MRRAVLCPPPAVPPEHIVRARGTPRPALIYREGRGIRGVPARLDAVGDLPCELDLVFPCEQRRVAVQGVEQQALVGLGDRRSPERFPEVKIHIGLPGFHPAVRHLCEEPEVKPFVGLYANAQMVRESSVIPDWTSNI